MVPKDRGKNTNSVVCALIKVLIEKLLFLLTKIVDLCTHLSLGARYHSCPAGIAIDDRPVPNLILSDPYEGCNS